LTFAEIRSFAIGELGWTRDRYIHATIDEFNLAARGYWRNWERSVAWMSREIIWELIRGNPYYKPEDKPKRKTEMLKLSIDEVKTKEEKIHKITEKDLKIFEKLRNGLA
jgi:hypothetical protein